MVVSDMSSISSRPGWDSYFLGITIAVSQRADCRRSRHGAVIVKNNRIISTGYNGSPPGGPSCFDGDCPRGLIPVEESGGENYDNCIALHAETNAIAFASYKDTQGATIYITGTPCGMCRKLIAAAGITTIVTPPQTFNV